MRSIEAAGDELLAAHPETLVFLSAAARNGYVQYVTEKIQSDESIEHFATINWWEEARNHVMEHYPLSSAMAALAVEVAMEASREITDTRKISNDKA